MAFSETIGQENWINNQIEAALEGSNAELKDLKNLVVDSNTLKWTITARWINQNQEITKNHIISILDKNKNKSRHDIYEIGKGAGVTFAVQYALQEMWYTPWTIDGVMGNQTKTAVRQFQEDWNKKNPLLKIEVDGLAGWVTLGRMSWAIMHPDWKTRVSAQSQAPQAPQAPEVQPSIDNIFDPLFKDNGLTIEQIKSKIEEKGWPKWLLIIRKKWGDLYFALKDPKDDDHIIRYVYNYNSGNPLIQRKELSSFSYGPKVTTLDPEDLRDVRNTDVSTYQKLADKYNQLYKTKGWGRETKKEVYRAIWYNLWDAIDNKDACNLVERATNDPIGKQFRTRWKNQKALWNKNTTLKDFLIWLQP